MKLSIVIMAHPKREKLARALSKKLGGVPIVWDEKNNVWDTCKRSWLKINPKAEFGLVLQDDAIIAHDFKKRAADRLVGRFVYNLFIPSALHKQVARAVEEKKETLQLNYISGEVAICIPTKYINSMIKFCDSRNAQTDQHITQWALKQRFKILYPIPALVDHSHERSLHRENLGLKQLDTPVVGCYFAGENKI